jgi:hypothetical protein
MMAAQQHGPTVWEMYRLLSGNGIISPRRRRFSKTGNSGMFFRHYFLKTPPFILEKRQILMQGSLSVWVAEVVQKFR